MTTVTVQLIERLSLGYLSVVGQFFSPGLTARIVHWYCLVEGLNHAHLDTQTRLDPSVLVISLLQRPLPTQHITNMPSARFEPVIPSIKRAAEQRVGAHSLCRVISALWDELETIWKVASVV